MELSRTSRDCMKRRKKKKKEKKEERSCQLFRHGAGYCAVNKISSAHVTITLVVNGSTGWLYIYIYLSKIRKEAPFYLSRNWVRKETILGEPVLWGNWKKKKEKIVRSNEMGWDDISRMQTRIII